MKILELRLKNLNSLYGEWLIDFTSPEYEAGGIFALTGPTGAGKSTILDAICLALYGATPRLGKITKGGNEIMSRQTGECYAEVIFESRQGRFRCHWEQRRSRKKPDGKLQDQEHQIADANTGQLIETRKSLVGTVIEEKTGMDFDRFTRSALLAQGGFDTFLRAEAEEKSKILEQITGSEIYSRISRRVHERQREERDKLSLLQAQTSGIVLLDPEQEQAVQEQIAKTQKQETELIANSAKTSEAIAWLRNMENLKKEILNLEAEEIRLRGDMENFKPQRIRLEQGKKAAFLDGIYAALTALTTQRATDLRALQTATATLPAQEASLKKQDAVFQAAGQRAAQAKAELMRAAPLIRAVRLLDQKIAEHARYLQELAVSREQEAAQIKAVQTTQEGEKQKKIAAAKQLQATQHYLKEHAKDEWLISGLAGIQEQLAVLTEKEREITRQKKELEQTQAAATQAARALEAATGQTRLSKNKLETVARNLQHGRFCLQNILGEKLLREYRAEKEALLRERAYIKRIENLELLRAKLENGLPCPLCGALEHPFATGGLPVPDEIDKKINLLTQIITRAEKQETLISELKQQEADSRKQLDNNENMEINAAHTQQSVVKKLAAEKENLFQLQTSLAELQYQVEHKLTPLGYHLEKAAPVELFALLKQKLQQWQEKSTQQIGIEKEISSIDSEIKSLDATIATLRKILTEKDEKLQQIKDELAAQKQQRNQLYGPKNPDTEEKRLHTATEQAEEAERQAADSHTQARQRLMTAQTHIEDLRQRLRQTEPELQKKQAEFAAELQSAGFESEKDFLAARLGKEEQEVLSFQAQELDNKATQLKTRHEDRKIRLEAETAKNITEQSLEELIEQQQQYEETAGKLRETKAALAHKLAENRAARERLREKQAAITAQKKECARFDKLHALIGSANGKKYRNFAQGLTFEIMVSHANRQLAKMSDRYLLIQDTEAPLELSVVDNYQAGEIRSTKNLSGGESFLVSLALALGLSQMASQNVRVDSLFLDEGFGTLDEEALETALETLAGLEQDGKIIGIISHMSALRERIGTHISIMPAMQGRSTLNGPGCKKLAPAMPP